MNPENPQNPSARDEEKNLFAPILLSVIVLIELYFGPSFFYPQIYKPVQFPHFHLEATVIFFSAMMFFFIYKTGFILRKTFSLKYFILHILSASLFFLFLFYLVSIFPFQPISETSILMKLASLFNKRVTYLVIRYRIIYMFLFALCHFFLFLTFFELKALFRKYLYTTLITIAVMELANTFLWKIFSSSVARSLLFTLKLCNLETISTINRFNEPVVGILGGEPFIISIAYACAGLEGIILFTMVYGIFLGINRERVNTKRAIIVGVIGLFIMYFTNIGRLFSLMLIGYFIDPVFANTTYHSSAGVVIYAIIIIGVIASTYRWVLSKTSS